MSYFHPLSFLSCSLITITYSHPHGHNTTLTPTSSPTALIISETDSLPATNYEINLYADDSTSDNSNSGISTMGLTLLISGAILTIISIFAFKVFLQWREHRKMKAHPHESRSSLWQKTKSISMSNLVSTTRTSISSPFPPDGTSMNANNVSVSNTRTMTTPVSTEIAPDKEQRLNEIWNESEQTVHEMEIDIDFNDDNVLSPKSKQSIGYTEGRDENMENESSSTKMADPDPRDDPNWRSPSKKYRITVVSIDELKINDQYEDDEIISHRNGYRHNGPRHMVQVNSQSVSEYAGSDIDDDGGDHHVVDNEMNEEIGNTFQRTDDGFYDDEMEEDLDEDDEVYPIDPYEHRRNGHGRVETLETLVMTDGAPIHPPLPTMEDRESGHSRHSSAATESVHGFEAEESIEEESDSLAVVVPEDE